MVMSFLIDVIKGIVIGIANIIPGVSGGTMAVTLGIYDKLIESISNIIKEFKESVRTLLPIIIGILIGIACFSYAIDYLLSEHTFVTCMTFIGLILGGLQALFISLRKQMDENRQKVPTTGIAAFIMAFLLAISVSLLNSSDEPLRILTPSIGMVIILFFVGILASATMVIPGVSGSMILMVIGFYYGIINTIKAFFGSLTSFDMTGLLQSVLLLVPFGIGVLIGIFWIAKGITYLFKHFGTETYFGILGLIIASPFAILYNTGLIWEISTIDLDQLGIGIVFAFIGGFITYKMGAKS